MSDLTTGETTSTSALYKPSSFIRYCISEGRVIILDLRLGNFILLNDTASAMWELIVSLPDHKQCVEQLSSRFKILHSRCESDLNQFIESCKEKRYFMRDFSAACKPEKKQLNFSSPTVFTAYISIFKTKRSLRHSGFSSLYQFHCGLTAAYKAGTNDVALQSHSLKAFRRAENFFSIREAKIDCLPRSLALHRFLISVGIQAYHCIGVKRFPFEAHAWIESGETTIFDSETFVKQFVEISRI